MARASRTPTNPQDDTGVTWRGDLSLEQREAMIRDAAYRRYAQRGYAPGHELEDWLAAETEIDRGTAEPMPEPAEGATEMEAQQSSVRGARKDDELKRIIRQHPRKAIPQVESVDPAAAPFRE